eukprot:augustus_masked-scaffold_4-processed-gene-17.13-mRNA-1 protein AED:1.00 eAED:1.00 QI:0/-1/0/0/-1/1/1/0/312
MDISLLLQNYYFLNQATDFGTKIFRSKPILIFTPLVHKLYKLVHQEVDKLVELEVKTSPTETISPYVEFGLFSYLYNISNLIYSLVNDQLVFGIQLTGGSSLELTLNQAHCSMITSVGPVSSDWINTESKNYLDVKEQHKSMELRSISSTAMQQRCSVRPILRKPFKAKSYKEALLGFCEETEEDFMKGICSSLVSQVVKERRLLHFAPCPDIFQYPRDPLDCSLEEKNKLFGQELTQKMFEEDKESNTSSEVSSVSSEDDSDSFSEECSVDLENFDFGPGSWCIGDPYFTDAEVTRWTSNVNNTDEYEDSV